MKSIEHDYIRIIKVSAFQTMGSSTVGKAREQEVSTIDSLRVKGSSPLKGKFFAEFFSLIQFWKI